MRAAERQPVRPSAHHAIPPFVGGLSIGLNGAPMTTPHFIAQLRIYGDLMPDTKYSLVTIHPLADEHDLLQQLNMQPEDCQLCDLYWAYEQWFFFLSIAYMPNQPPSTTIHRNTHARQGFSFTVRTHVCPLTRSTIQTVLHALAPWIDREHLIFDSLMDGRTIPIVEADLARASR